MPFHESGEIGVSLSQVQTVFQELEDEAVALEHQRRMCQNWEYRNQQNVLGTSRPPSFWMLGHQHQGRKRFPALVEHLALLNQGNVLLHRRAEPKELAYFIERTAKA